MGPNMKRARWGGGGASARVGRKCPGATWQGRANQETWSNYSKPLAIKGLNDSLTWPRSASCKTTQANCDADDEWERERTSLSSSHTQTMTTQWHRTFSRRRRRRLSRVDGETNFDLLGFHYEPISAWRQQQARNDDNRPYYWGPVWKKYGQSQDSSLCGALRSEPCQSANSTSIPKQEAWLSGKEMTGRKT